MPPPIDRAIDQQIGIINWGIIHPSSAMPFPLLHFHYASFWRRGTGGETAHDSHLPLISILIKRPSDNDQSKQSAGQKIPEHKEWFSSKFLQAWPKCYYYCFLFPQKTGSSLMFCSITPGHIYYPFFIVFFQFIRTFPTVVEQL